MTTLLRPDELIHRLQLDKRRCFVVTGQPGEGKTRLAEQMARRYGGQRLDMLSIFAADPGLAGSIDTFTPGRCRELLLPYAKGELVLVDEMDFLWHTWDAAGKQGFLTIIERWMKPAFFGVFLVPDPTIENFVMIDQDGRPRIFSLHDLQALT